MSEVAELYELPELKHEHRYIVKKEKKVLLHNVDGIITGYDLFTTYSRECGETLPDRYARTKL